jgi:endonuclease/exonuclease/phosphatase family metal-dependent hydrolase
MTGTEASSVPAEGPFGALIETRVRVLTWNLWWRFGPWEQRAPAIAAELERLDPDIACLQEVWAEGATTLAAELADRLGFHHAFDARLDVDGVRFGNAVLSRWPITTAGTLPLPAPQDKEELRLCLRADVHGPRGPIQVFCTHLNWRLDQSAIRQAQVRAICELIAGSRPEGGRTFPPVLCGDFNADPDSDEMRLLTGRSDPPVPGLVFHDAWAVAGTGPGMTWDNRNPYAALELEPDRRIDYVLVGWPKAGGAGHVVSARLAGLDPVDGVVPSDHLAVVAELRY